MFKYLKKAILFVVYIFAALGGWFGNFGVGKNMDPWEKWFNKK